MGNAEYTGPILEDNDRHLERQTPTYTLCSALHQTHHSKKILAATS